MLLSSHQQQLCTAVPHHHRAAWCILCRPHKTDTRNRIGIKCDALAPAAAAAAGLTSALALGFLPWSGCSQGGFYATGVQGTHGKDCQAIYQPAAAAEERFAALLKQQQQLVAQHQNSTVDRAAEGTATSNNTSTGGNTSTSDQGPTATGMQSQKQLTAADQMHAVPPAAKDLVRDILQEDNRQRTKQLVDDAWQTLE